MRGLVWAAAAGGAWALLYGLTLLMPLWLVVLLLLAVVAWVVWELGRAPTKED